MKKPSNTPKQFNRVLIGLAVTASAVFLLYVLIGHKSSIVSYSFAFNGPPAGTPGSGNGAIGVNSANNLSVGTSTPTAETKFLIVASSTDTTNFALKILQPGTNPILFIRNDGSIGVATSGLTYAFNVSGSIYASGNVTCGGSCGGGSNAAANITPGGFNFAQSTTTGNFAFPASLWVGTSTSAGQPQILSVYGGGYFSGNVGIGTAQPSSSLHVVGGDIMISGAGAGLSIGTTTSANAGSILATANATTTNLSIIGLAGASGCLSVTASGAVVTSTCSSSGTPAGASGAVQFASSTNFGGDAARFFWDNVNNRLGIMTGSPSSTLHVAGTIRVTNYIKFDDAVSSTYLGFQAGLANATSNNTFIGYQAGKANTTGAGNTFTGFQAGFSNTTGAENSFYGQQAGTINLVGIHDSFFGFDTGHFNTGDKNSFFGSEAGNRNDTGNDNTFVGFSAGNVNTAGQRNTYIGDSAGISEDSGTNNVFVGYRAGNNSTGSSNVFIGAYAGYTEGGSNMLYINNVSGTPLIYGNFASGLVGINTTSAATTFDVNGSSTFRNNVNATGTVDTISVCGTSPSVVGTWAGRATTGSNASSTCTITFSTAFRNAPYCVVTSETTSSISYKITPSTASLMISTASSSAFKSNILDFNCIGS